MEHIRPKRVLSVFLLTMINVATIGSIKNWPVIAEYGFSAVFYFLLATLIFFIPVSLVSAELATGWPHTGGVFAWVKEAFGHRVGFLAAWLLWMQNIVWYPTALSFIAATIAFIFKPELAQNSLYTFVTILIIFWAITIVNFKGMRTSGWISSLCMILGTFLPGLLIIALGGFWFFGNNPLAITLTWDSFIPDMSSIGQLVLFSGVLISLAGMEMSAVHARDVAHPHKDYPKAIFYSLLIILGLSIPGILAISIVVPQEDISLVAGSLQAIGIFFEKYHLLASLPLMAFLITLGTIGSVSTWAVGPTKGLLGAAQVGDLPPLFQKLNKNAMPVPLLILQAIVVSFLSLIFIFLPTINEAYWMLVAMVTELYLLMYLLMFAAAIKLRYKRPHVNRAYKVPGGKIGMWVVSGIGFLSSLFTMIIGLFPPTHIAIMKPANYMVLMIGGTIFFSLGPTFILLFQKTKWKRKKATS